MKRLRHIGFVLFLTLGVFFQVTAQEAEGEMFVENLLRHLERANWEVSEIGVLERHLLTYEWKNLSGVDPEIVARALSYGREDGIGAPGELAEIAHQLSLEVREMVQSGMEPRDMLRASVNAVRTVATERLELREGGQVPDLAQTFREQIRRQVAGAERSSFRRQATRRVSNPARRESWSPPTSGERASGGVLDVPGGPGNTSGPAHQSPGGNGGR